MALKDERETSVFAITIRSEKLRPIRILQPPLIFSDSQPSEEILSPIEGIRKYGPYDTNTSDKQVSRDIRGVEFFIFYPKGENKVCESLSYLISMLKEGYFQKRHSHDVDFRGFEEEFRLKSFVPNSNDFIEYQPGSLQKELRRINFDEVFERKNAPVVIIGGTTHRSVSKNREQYLEAKREFTNMDIPSQYAAFYEYATGGAGILYQVNKPNFTFGYSLWNFALNIYGKVGGVPWIIRQRLSATSRETIDLAIGMRFVRYKYEKGFSIGFATIMDRFGKLIGIVSSSPFKTKFEGATGMIIPKTIMKNIMDEALNKAINDPRVKEISQEKESLNIAIHRLSTFHFDEISGIRLAINEKANSLKIKPAFITISDNMPILVFDKTVEDWNSEKGTAIMLSDNAAILYTVTIRGEKISYPIAVIAQNLEMDECPFKTLEEACNHIFSLTNLHWQTTIPGLVKLPATLEFAQNIAQLSSYRIRPKEDSWLWRTLWFI